MREIILDIETSGLEHKEGHRVIEIGCIELNKKEVGSHFHQYINPLKTLTPENIKIHGITNEYLEDKPLFEDIADSFLDFIKDSPVIAHNANFDIGFLNSELEKLYLIQQSKNNKPFIPQFLKTKYSAASTRYAPDSLLNALKNIVKLDINSKYNSKNSNSWSSFNDLFSIIMNNNTQA